MEKKTPRKHISSRTIASLALVSGIAFILLIFAWLLPTVKKNLIEQRCEMLKRLTEPMWSCVSAKQIEVEQGKIPLEEAKEEIIERFRAIRYGEDTDDYYWIVNTTPRVLMHPYRRDLEGQDVGEYKDPDGKHLFADMVALALSPEGEGFLEYRWQYKDDSTIIKPKISYVRYFQPWGWIIGTGVYVDDIHKDMSDIRRTLLFFMLLILVSATVGVGMLSWFAVKAQDALDEQIRKNELGFENFETLFNLIPFSCVITNIEGKIILANQHYCDVAGLLQQEIQGRTPDDLGRYCDPEVGQALVEELQTTGAITAREIPINTPEGRLWLLISSRVIDWQSNEKAYLTATVDITKKKEAEEALRRSETLYRSLFECANDAIFLLREGRFISVNAKTMEMFACSKKQLIGSTPQAYSPEYQADGRLSEEKAQEKIARAFEGKQMRFEWIHVRQDGSQFDAEVSLTRVDLADGVYLLAVVRDVTERKQREAELKRFVRVIKQTSEMVVITDTEPTIIYVNPAFEKVSGYTSEEAVGQNPRILGSGNTPIETYEDLWNRIKAGETWRGRFINRKKDGTLYTEDATISPLRDSSGDIVNYVAVKRDVTHELKLEQRVRQAQKMEAMGALAGGIAHDFNNILSAIIGYTELAMLDAGDDSGINKSLRQVFKAGQRAKDLVAQILTFSRQVERERKPQRLHIVAKEVLKLLRGSIPSTVEIRQNIDTSCAPVIADATEIHQILMNLCTNAYHALPDTGGVIEVALTEIQIGKNEAQIYLDISQGRYVQLTVADNGHGMDKNTMNRIFEPYFTTKEQGKGTGLGLATVHGIVEEMGGTIRIYSEVGKGTTFSILLPAIETDFETSNKDGLFHMESLKGEERILLVDDEEPLAQFAGSALSRLGYRVTTRTKGIEALTLFQSDPTAFDLVITDQMMPGMRGTELSKEIARIRPNIPIIMCSGFGNVLNNPGKTPTSIREHVMKPILIADLAAAVRRALDRPE